MFSYLSVILVDGHWSNWADWSVCSVSCGSGSRSRDRKCDNPSPANGGDNCVDGLGYVVETCKMSECSGMKNNTFVNYCTQHIEWPYVFYTRDLKSLICV